MNTGNRYKNQFKRAKVKTNQDIKCVATIEEVKTYEVNDRVKINFDLSKIYLFKESGELLHSPYKS